LSKDTSLIIVWSNCPSEAQAAELAQVLVREKLAACVHILPRGRSFYIWEGKMNQEDEWTLKIKTRAALFDDLKARLTVLHPFDVPEILATPVVDCGVSYGRWVMDSTQGCKD